MEKYIILNPWSAGFTNVLMSYEIAFAAAYVTNRSIIVPPTAWCVLIDDKNSPREIWQDIWQVCDKDAANEEFKILNLLDFESFTNSKVRPAYTWVDQNILANSTTIKDIPQLNDSPTCWYNSSNNINESDFQNFTNNRPLLDINHEEQFLNISGFGHYWYNIYANGPAARNEMKRKINKAFKYKVKYYELAKTSINKKCDSYNAIHVRSPWQLIYDDYLNIINIKNSPEMLLQQVKLLYSTDKPLYIATDIETKSFFNQLLTEYKIIFYEDLDLPPLEPLEKIAIDQIICSKADSFYGSYYSTFSKRINIMRGVEGNQAFDYMGFNTIGNKLMESKSPWPWQDTISKHWAWHDSSYLQWTVE